MSEHATIDNRLKGPLSGVRVIEMGQLVAGLSSVLEWPISEPK
ncbi:MAG: hypothetical protein Ct9H300mP14_02770 [Gammaproteobacteria bacterium]|nr:MAG: hypothetical protein Ct9H300mP14_02770 [Gammaproteobacteria bacterium]